MCLNNAIIDVRDLFGKNKKHIYCWKVVRRGMTNRTKSNIYPVFFNVNKKYNLGEINKSNRKDKKPDGKCELCYNNEKKYYFNKGIHVHLTLEKAELFKHYDSEYIVRVKCLRKDYLGHNNDEAVFMAVEFPAEVKFNDKD